MKKIHLLASIAAATLVLSQPVSAEKWVALGLLTTQVKGNPAKVEFVQINDFDSRELCIAMVKSESMSSDYIGGRNGTNGHLPEIQWNFDANCWLKSGD